MNNLIHCDMCGDLMTKRWGETIDGKTYCRDCVPKKRLIDLGEPTEFDGTDEIVCPYCGHRYEDSYECGGNDGYFEEECDVQRRPEIQADSRESGRQTMSTLDILGNTSEQADSIRLMLKVRGMKDGRFIDADPLIILKADNHQGSDRWDVYVSKTVYPTAESYGTLAGILRMLANDVEIMAHEKEMGGRR